MISKNDLLLLLSDVKKLGIDTKEQERNLLYNNDMISVLKFLNANRPLDLVNFYEQIRRSYNEHHSKLYVNIVKEKTEEVLTTLSALQTQILLYSRKVEDKPLFFRWSRADEISKCITRYYMTYDLNPCIDLLSYVKADIKAFEEINKI